MAKKLYYKIGEACKSLDIQPYVLRYWETEFPALKPNKSKSGQRVYSEQDLSVIRRIKELLYDEGYTIAGAKKKLDGEDLETPAAAARETKPAAAPKAKAAPEPAAAPEREVESAPEPEAAPDPPAAKKPATKAPKAKATKAVAKKPAAKAAEPEPAGLPAATRKGLEKALADTRSILEILDKSGG